MITALGQIRATTPLAGIDRKTCNSNFTTVGSLATGKTYTSFADYPTVTTLDAIAGLYVALASYTPVPGTPWTVTSIAIDPGSITATLADTQNRSMSFQAVVQPVGNGSRVTVAETVPGLFFTIDLRGSLCHTLADVPKG